MRLEELEVALTWTAKAARQERGSRSAQLEMQERVGDREAEAPVQREGSLAGVHDQELQLPVARFRDHRLDQQATDALIANLWDHIDALHQTCETDEPERTGYAVKEIGRASCRERV